MKQHFVEPLILLGGLDLLLVWILSRLATVRPATDATSSEKSESKLSTIAYLLALLAGIAGLGLRLYGFDRSLWLDEFGTLWTIEGSFSQMWGRVNAFQGQSPFYYSLVWLIVHLLGESEVALRLLSLLLGLGTAYGMYLMGSFLYGEKAGLVSASLVWLTPSMVQTSSEARPYSLALFMTVILFYGFARAAGDGDRRGRLLFIVGGAGLFCAQYVLILVAVGIALGYTLFPPLRSKYPARHFILDVGLQLLFVSWCLPHLIQFWNRRESLSWLGSSKNYLVFVELIGGFIVCALAPYLVRGRSTQSNFQSAIDGVCALAAAVAIGCVGVLSYFEINLLYPRYFVVIVIPMALLASSALMRLPRTLLALPFAFWLLFVVGALFIDFKVYGSFSQAGFQDWRTAVARLNPMVHSEPNTPVLYRSGFVEDDQLIDGRTTVATRSPLRSPGQPPVTWTLVPLTYNWLKPGREAYFRQSVEPAIQSASVFYFLSCSTCFNAGYSDAVVTWVGDKFPGKFKTEQIEAGRGIVLIRFVSRMPVAVLRSIEIPRGQNIGVRRNS